MRELLKVNFSIYGLCIEGTLLNALNFEEKCIHG